MSTKQKDEKHVVYSVKVSPDQAAVLDKICETIGVNSYQMFQMFFYTLCKAAAPMHELSPEIRKIMTLMETDVGWANAFNLANPNHLHVAQAILILEQEGKKGFGAVMIDKPFMDKAPEMVDDIDPHRNDPQMTENVDYILERVTEVTMHGIYRRLRLVGGMMGCDYLSDILLELIERQGKDLREEDDRIQMQGEALFSESGRRIEYGKRTKAKHHRTPDGEAMRQQRIVFSDEDRELAREESERSDIERLSRGHSDDDNMEKEMGFKPFDQEW